MTTRLTDNRKKNPPFVAIPVKLLEDNNISDGALRLYGHLKRRLYFNSLSPSNEELEKKIKKSEDTISRQLKDLERNGYITIDRNNKFFSEGGTWSNNRRIKIVEL